jgi:telomere length regulation protein
MAMTCLQLHAEMALQTSRALESARSSFRASPTLRSDASKMTIKIPYLNGGISDPTGYSE